MAISPKDRYPGQISTADPAGYPEGKARNITLPGDGTGTPWEEDIVNDILGLQQALLAAAFLAPSGTPDKVGASQYLDAIREVGTQQVAVATLYAGIKASGSMVGLNTGFVKSTFWSGEMLEDDSGLVFGDSGLGRIRVTTGAGGRFEVHVDLFIQASSFETLFIFAVAVDGVETNIDMSVLTPEDTGVALKDPAKIAFSGIIEVQESTDVTLSVRVDTGTGKTISVTQGSFWIRSLPPRFT